VVASAAGATSKDIAWLRLEVTDRRGKGMLSDATTVLRIDTKGGVAEGPCGRVGEHLSVAYAADIDCYWRIEGFRRALAPAAVALPRLISSGSHQFPELAFTFRESAVHTRELIADIFSNVMRERQIRSADAGFLPGQFLYAVVDGHTRDLILSGKTARSDKDLRARVVAAVALFLDGCHGRPAPRS